MSLTAPLDRDVFRRYAGLALPRHVAYPMPTWWSDCTSDDGAQMLAEARSRDDAPDMSLYLHIPFCESSCRYCACTRVALPKCEPTAAERAARYVQGLIAEIATVARTIGAGPRAVRQIHWGGGTPTYLDHDQLRAIQSALREHFLLRDDAEIAMEVDPRRVDRATLALLHELGFNRISLGIQDFDPQVQEHVGRVQPVELVQQTVHAARDVGFTCINFDLIYGLPMQTLDSVRRTIEQTIAIGPDRVAYYQYAMIPDKIASQRGLDYNLLPDSEDKLDMFLLGLERFEPAGYAFIGLDHFAKQDEPLAKAARDGTLQRNFQGMTTGGGLDLIGLGASSIGHLSQVGFLQNVRGAEDYLRRVEAGELATFRGKRLTDDDRIRQAVLGDLYCKAEVRPAQIEAEFGIDFSDYFARECAIMRELAADGLVEVTDDAIRVTRPLGRVLMRTVAAVFDAYLEPEAYRAGDRQYFSTNA